MRCVLPLLAAALCQGCVWFVSVPPLDPLPKARVVLADVRYAPQRGESDCGVACLTTLLRHYGSELTVGQVRSQLVEVEGGGTVYLEIIFGARRNGFRAEWYYDSSINDLRRKLLAGRPLILFLHATPAIVRYTGRRRGHYVVAVGYDDEQHEAIIHSGDKAFDTISYRRLQLQWSRADFLTLLIEK